MKIIDRNTYFITFITTNTYSLKVLMIMNIIIKYTFKHYHRNVVRYKERQKGMIMEQDSNNSNENLWMLMNVIKYAFKQHRNVFN